MPEISSIGVLTAFAAGIISFLSPCVLPLVPGYVSYVAGHAVGERPTGGAAAMRLPAVALSLFFVLGFSTVFVLLGASATLLGQLLASYRYELNIVGGAIVFLFGLFLVGVLRPSWLARELRFRATVPGGRPFSAYVLGLAFAFGWTPCIGAILTVSAASTSVTSGVALLTVYALGLAVPFVLAAAFTGALTDRLKVIGRLGRMLQRLAGGVMILMGLATMTGQLSALSYWLLDAFPALANIG